MNKKSLLKKMSIVVASAAMVVTALPLTASAASYKSGDYTASVNFMFHLRSGTAAFI